jgi:hypothetical protein
VRNKDVLQSQGGQEYPTYNLKIKTNWISRILCRNCLLQHITEGVIEGEREVTERQGRRCKWLLGDRMEKTRH